MRLHSPIEVCISSQMLALSIAKERKSASDTPKHRNECRQPIRWLHEQSNGSSAHECRIASIQHQRLTKDHPEGTYFHHREFKTARNAKCSRGTSFCPQVPGATQELYPAVRHHSHGCYPSLLTNSLARAPPIAPGWARFYVMLSNSLNAGSNLKLIKASLKLYMKEFSFPLHVTASAGKKHHTNARTATLHSSVTTLASI